MNKTENELRGLELRLLDPAFRRDAEAVASILADDFREFGTSGRVWNKNQALVALQKDVSRTFAISELHVESLSNTVALVTYRMVAGDRSSLRSSVWVLRNESWQIVFHQGTDCL